MERAGLEGVLGKRIELSLLQGGGGRGGGSERRVLDLVERKWKF